MRNGYLGEISKILVNVGDPAIDYNLAEEPMPKEVNWNKWCGPAPMLAYNHRLAPSRNDVDFWPDWRKFKETGGGILCDWGAHMFDIAQWAIGMDDSGPIQNLHLSLTCTQIIWDVSQRDGGRKRFDQGDRFVDFEHHVPGFNFS